MSHDVIGDLLTTIRNALKCYKRFIVVPCSGLKLGVVQVLKDEGFIKDFVKNEDESGKIYLKIFLKYVDGVSAINQIKRISKPGCRFYERANVITPVIGGLGIAILSTSSGIMTDRNAKKLGVGGEVICHVW